MQYHRTVSFLRMAQNRIRILTGSSSGAIVEKVVEYLAHKAQYQNAGVKDDVPDFSERIPPELALELCVSSSRIMMGFLNDSCFEITGSWLLITSTVGYQPPVIRPHA